MNFVGIDLGTSSVKLVIMNDEGKVVEALSKDYDVSYPKPGFAEQNPEDWWEAVRDGLKELLAKSKLSSEAVKGIGFSGQMHGLVMLDEHYSVLRPAILWCDQRTEEECVYLNEVIGQDKLSKYTGNKALTGFTAPKILWVKKHEPEIFAKAKYIMLPKDYIRLKLTGEFATDVSDASGMLLLDVEGRKWSKEMLEITGITEAMLPRVVESWEPTGTLTEEVAEYTGLATATIVVGGAGDQAAGAVGTGTVSEGILSAALGTSGVIFASSEKYEVDDDNRLHSFCHANGKYHQMGVMLSAASCLKWWVEQINKGLCGEDSAKTFDFLLEEAAKSKVGANGVVYLPYLMGERTPHSDPHAKGTFVGMTMTTERGDMTRAILEGVCFGLRDSLEILRSLKVPIEEVRVSGGGSKSVLWRQILADVLNTKVALINSKEGPAYGAAILAAVGCGLFKTVDEACEKLIKVTNEVSPIPENVEKYNKVYEVFTKLYPSLKDSFKLLSF
ncbi:xylulokinase [Clostridium sp. 19966]|uniref:xylulokinase n=1 Tax=Clostridium sp. 19966 TaxID=2768166 RepID=UPI0028E02624|nr:xylulokinase [Clostridium sp. 19966]MDT8716186.1 xylulokinase [Clostridium sp. 19966]